MSRQQDSNAVSYAVRQVCALQGVELIRMQSRVVTVVGKGGRDRPMFFGQWTDMKGEEHSRGMTDYLARPRVPLRYIIGAVPLELEDVFHIVGKPTHVTIPLWIEIKSGKDKLSYDQLAFKQYVEANGESWVNVHDDIRPLMEWFESRGVRK